MKKIKRYLYRRRIRKLAEMLLASQTLYTDTSIQLNRIEAAIQTAEKFYERWRDLTK